VVFWRRCAEAERYIGLEVAEEDNGDERGERLVDGRGGVIELGSKILS
jgi:hypothetical protein